eukprot:tig00000204_g17727.t1
MRIANLVVVSWTSEHVRVNGEHPRRVVLLCLGRAPRGQWEPATASDASHLPNPSCTRRLPAGPRGLLPGRLYRFLLRGTFASGEVDLAVGEHVVRERLPRPHVDVSGRNLTVSWERQFRHSWSTAYTVEWQEKVAGDPNVWREQVAAASETRHTLLELPLGKRFRVRVRVDGADGPHSGDAEYSAAAEVETDPGPPPAPRNLRAATRPVPEVGASPSFVLDGNSQIVSGTVMIEVEWDAPMSSDRVSERITKYVVTRSDRRNPPSKVAVIELLPDGKSYSMQSTWQPPGREATSGTSNSNSKPYYVQRVRENGTYELTTEEKDVPYPLPAPMVRKDAYGVDIPVLPTRVFDLWLNGTYDSQSLIFSYQVTASNAFGSSVPSEKAATTGRVNLRQPGMSRDSSFLIVDSNHTETAAVQLVKEFLHRPLHAMGQRDPSQLRSSVVLMIEDFPEPEEKKKAKEAEKQLQATGGAASSAANRSHIQEEREALARRRLRQFLTRGLAKVAADRRAVVLTEGISTFVGTTLGPAIEGAAARIKSEGSKGSLVAFNIALLEDDSNMERTIQTLRSGAADVDALRISGFFWVPPPQLLSKDDHWASLGFDKEASDFLSSRTLEQHHTCGIWVQTPDKDHIKHGYLRAKVRTVAALQNQMQQDRVAVSGLAHRLASRDSQSRSLQLKRIDPEAADTDAPAQPRPAPSVPAAVVLIGGTRFRIEELLYWVRAGLPILVIQGTGGLADRLGTKYKEWLSDSAAVENEPPVAELFEDGNLSFVSLETDSVDEAATHLNRFLSDGDGREEDGRSQVVQDAWSRFAIYRESAEKQQDVARILGFLVQLLSFVATLTVVITSFLQSYKCAEDSIIVSYCISGMVTRAQKFLEYISVAWPIALSALLSVYSLLGPSTKFYYLAMSSERIKSELFKYRAGVSSDYREKIAPEKLAERMRDISGRIMHGELSSTSLASMSKRVILVGPGGAKFVRHPEAGKVDAAAAAQQDPSAKEVASRDQLRTMEFIHPSDDGFSRLDPKQYLEFRVRPKLRRYKAEAEWSHAWLRFLQISAIFSGAAGAILGLLGYQLWIAVTTSLAAVFAAWQDLENLEKRLMQMNMCHTELNNIQASWNALRPDEKLKRTNIERLVLSAENVILGEAGWMVSNNQLSDPSRGRQSGGLGGGADERQDGPGVAFNTVGKLGHEPGRPAMARPAGGQVGAASNSEAVAHVQHFIGTSRPPDHFGGAGFRSSQPPVDVYGRPGSGVPMSTPRLDAIPETPDRLSPAGSARSGALTGGDGFPGGDAASRRRPSAAEDEVDAIMRDYDADPATTQPALAAVGAGVGSTDLLAADPSSARGELAASPAAGSRPGGGASTSPRAPGPGRAAASVASRRPV